MADIEDLKNAMVKKFLQATTEYWFPWRPGLSSVNLGTYAQCNGLTVFPQGNIGGSFGCGDLVTAVPIEGSLAASSIASDDLKRIFTQWDQSGKMTLQTEDIGQLDVNAKTEVSYSSTSDISFQTFFDDVTIYSMGSADTTGFLQEEVWPRLQSHSAPKWDNHDWVICGKIVVARSYAFAGGCHQDTKFGFSMSRGGGIKDLFNGSISGSITVDAKQDVDIHDSAYDGGEMICGYSLYHFDGGRANLYLPW